VSSLASVTSGQGGPVSSARPTASLAWARRAGYVILGLELAGFLAWSTVLYRRFALTFDFAVYHQPWYLIAHGQFDPYSSVSRIPFWRNDAEFAVWILAPFYWLWPHDLILLWLQDAAVAVAQLVAFTWICELVSRHRPGKDGAWLAGAGLFLLMANPWVWWAVSFDVHEEPLTVMFAVLLARDLAHRRRRAWAWVPPLLLGGAPTTTYVAGLGLGALVAGRRFRLTGAAMVLVAISYSLFIVLIKADLGVPLARHYGYLAVTGPPGSAGNAGLTTPRLIEGIAAHPLRVLAVLWSKSVDIWANIAPAGAIGLLFPLTAPLLCVVLLENTLSPGFRFAEPIFQALPIYILLPVGTVAVLGWLARRHRLTGLVVTGLLCAQTAGWAMVWLPRTADQWLRVPPATAVTLARIQARIPATAEVIASEGVIGRFSGREDLHELTGHQGPIPVTGKEVWVIVAPMAGSEMQSTASATALISELAGPLQATLITHANGVWAFRWHPPPGTRALGIPGEASVLPAWAAPLARGTAGRPVLAGPPATWHVTSTGGEGYVADELAWQVPPARYLAVAELSATGPVNVEVWNDTGNVLLARQNLAGTVGIQQVVLPVNARTPYRAHAYPGWGPFRADFVPPPAGERLEVRVWSPGGVKVNVYSAELLDANAGVPVSGVHG
jgi:hypothetical protein